MSYSRITPDVSERLQLLGGTVALVLATVCLVALTMLGVGGELDRMALGLLTVGLFVVGALSIGKSEQPRV
jgi:hypothetical protein